MILHRIVALLLIGFASTVTASSALAGALVDLAKWSDESTIRVDHSAWGAFLSKYVVASPDGVNRVRYGAVTGEDRQRLDAYIATLATVDSTLLGKDEAFAYWANLYNALTVDLILDRYPVKSIRDIKPSLLAIGPWKMTVVTVHGEQLSLDDIEHGILRAAWKDNRIHYAVNCASIGCPNLRAEPFTADDLDGALTQAARDYVNHPRGAHFDEAGRLVVSSIYDWYREDFGGSEQGVIDHMLRYAGPGLAERLQRARGIARYDYDWTLNDAK
ncbi:MAG: DUF547 domain-containing protein [Amphiplicatus sp.]